MVLLKDTNTFIVFDVAFYKLNKSFKYFLVYALNFPFMFMNCEKNFLSIFLKYDCILNHLLKECVMG